MPGYLTLQPSGRELCLGLYSHIFICLGFFHVGLSALTLYIPLSGLTEQQLFSLPLWHCSIPSLSSFTQSLLFYMCRQPSFHQPDPLSTSQSALNLSVLSSNLHYFSLYLHISLSLICSWHVAVFCLAQQQFPSHILSWSGLVVNNVLY